ncbi:glutamine synthetase family protein [Fodinisporobacter ferrooxydans]|uniref:glutamine synthetase n=1 Tax=Fodinisporobacter ferrooxydans TaxID=2901836 RepID=A0ABY4CPS4_9BACL|nr:glutamine synthetase family protein [Alicyclobacillaceae bacterium MYW30-H2]
MTNYDWINHIQQVIHDRQIHTIRVTVPDLSNISRARYIPVRHFLETAFKDTVSFPSVLFSMDTSAEIHKNVGSGFAGGFPNWQIQTDLSTFSILPYKQGVARVIGDLCDSNGSPIKQSPRHVLKKVLDTFQDLGYLVRGSFEYEFYVFVQEAARIEPVWKGLHCFSETKQAEVENIITTLFMHLTEMGAGPEVANTEYGSGQFEVTHSPFWGVEISDMAFYYRTSIKEILHGQGYKATFMSKPASARSGSGAHMNHSLYDQDGHNLFYDPSSADGLSDICRWFIGGQLTHAKALCALANPTINSYKRLVPHSFAPTTISWGYEHRGAMIRVPSGRGEVTRIENRLAGADTNPYIALAAVLAAGLDGILHKIEPSAPIQNTDPYGSDFEHLPSSLLEALRELEKNNWLRDSLGADFIEDYLSLRYAEYDRFLAHVTDWEMKEYFDIF